MTDPLIKWFEFILKDWVSFSYEDVIQFSLIKTFHAILVFYRNITMNPISASGFNMTEMIFEYSIFF